LDFLLTSHVALVAAVFLLAIVYSSVGHGGASGYLAAMAFFGLAPEAMKPAALVMNLAVTALLVARFWHRRMLEWRLILPFIVLSVPFAYLGGAWRIDAAWYRWLVALALATAAFWLFANPKDRPALRMPSVLAALPTGAGLGLLSGLTGVGGGIFLSPLLLAMRWADMRMSAGVAAVFIFVNSAAALAGFAGTGGRWTLPVPLWLLAGTAAAGGAIGSAFAAHGRAASWLRAVLGLILLLAAAKMIVSTF
jgi:uncharacterized membrane protein YfcA